MPTPSIEIKLKSLYGNKKNGTDKLNDDTDKQSGRKP
jgi:hypothetical protein